MALDIDGVVADQIPPILSIVSEQFGIEAERADIRSYSFTESLSLPAGSDRIIIAEYNGHRLLEASPLPGAIHSIGTLQKDFDVQFVTSRNVAARAVTETWFLKHGVPDPVIHFVGHSEKADFLIMEGFSIVVEDAGDIALRAAEGGLDTFLIDAPWNQGLIHRKLRRVASWGELVDQARELIV